MSTIKIEKLIERGMPRELSINYPEIIFDLYELIENERYGDAHDMLNKAKNISNEQKILIRKAFADCLLKKCQREWTNHGIWRTFRFWSDQEKVGYLNNVNRVIELLRPLVPNVTYGFGSVLGFIRDGNFIPHDDDMDLLVAFPYSRDNSYTHSKKLLMAHLSKEGLKCYNENKTHFTVNGVDIFIGFCESDQCISWFPSRRRNGLNFHDIFPTSTIKVLGVNVVIPNKAEKYLNVTYGPDWPSPDSNWNHPWNISEYLEFCK